jgi:glyoxylase-like metal-dependent hydrolase (beta-lactamase superfamily II)
MPIKAFIGADAVSAILTGSDDRNGLALAKKEGIYPADYLYRAAVIEQGLITGNTFRIGSLGLSFISTPGHCDGHGSYLLKGQRNSLFTGDCLFAGGKIALSNTADCSIEKYRETILSMAQLEFDALFPGHGSLVLFGGKEHLQIAIDGFQSLTLPRSFL